MDFIEKIKKTMANPKVFFNSIKKEKGYLKPWLYYTIVMAICLLAALIFSMPDIIAELSKSPQIPSSLIGISATITLTLTFIIMIVLFAGLIFAIAGIQHLFLLMVGAKKGYLETFKFSCYATTPYIILPIFILLDYIPVLGVVVYYLGVIGLSIYSLIIEVIGAKTLHNISTVRAVVAVVVIPLVLGIIIFIAAAILLGILMYGEMQNNGLSGMLLNSQI
jgi:hypothetical protein